jgi:hypothetical protein
MDRRLGGTLNVERRKVLPFQDYISKSSVIQLEASRYTNCAILAPMPAIK